VQSSRERDRKIGERDNEIAFDVVVEGVEERDNRSRIVSALNSLTPVQRECVVMAYYDGFSQREIANNLGVPIGTVKTRVRDGVIRLREMLGSEL
jgi:RNA polymerase sigma-70 factor (ECF subfamily)